MSDDEIAEALVTEFADTDYPRDDHKDPDKEIELVRRLVIDSNHAVSVEAAARIVADAWWCGAGNFGA